MHKSVLGNYVAPLSATNVNAASWKNVLLNLSLIRNKSRDRRLLVNIRLTCFQHRNDGRSHSDWIDAGVKRATRTLVTYECRMRENNSIKTKFWPLRHKRKRTCRHVQYVSQIYHQPYSNLCCYFPCIYFIFNILQPNLSALKLVNKKTYMDYFFILQHFTLIIII